MAGHWTDSDGDRASVALVVDLLAAPPLADFQQKNSRAPVLRIYPLRNRSSEHINLKQLQNQLQRHLLATGKVRFKASQAETQDTRRERAEGQGPGAGQSLATDYLLNGWIMASAQQGQGRPRRAYSLTLNLIQVDSNEVAWSGVFKLEK